MWAQQAPSTHLGTSPTSRHAIAKRPGRGAVRQRDTLAQRTAWACGCKLTAVDKSGAAWWYSPLFYGIASWLLPWGQGRAEGRRGCIVCGLSRGLSWALGGLLVGRLPRGALGMGTCRASRGDLTEFRLRREGGVGLTCCGKTLRTRVLVQTWHSKMVGRFYNYGRPNSVTGYCCARRGCWLLCYETRSCAGQRTYWLCAFTVNQCAGMWGGPVLV